MQEALEKYAGHDHDEDEDKTDEAHMESDEPKQQQQQLVKSTDSTTSNQTFILNRSTSSGVGMSAMAQQGSDNEQQQSISELTEPTVIEANMLLSPESQPFDSVDVSPDTLALDFEQEEEVRKRPRLQANSNAPHMISFANLRTAGSEESEEAVAPISGRSLVLNDDTLSDSMDEEEDQAQKRNHENDTAKQSEGRVEMKRSNSRGSEKPIAQFIPFSDPDGAIGTGIESAEAVDESKKMFSMFIEIERKRTPGLRKMDSGDDSTKDSVSERIGSGRKRWSTVSSMDRISLGSQDLIAHDNSIADDSMSLGGFSVDESGNVSFDESDQTPCSMLGHDLLRMFLDQLDCDMQVLVDDKSTVEIQK